MSASSRRKYPRDEEDCSGRYRRKSDDTTQQKGPLELRELPQAELPRFERPRDDMDEEPAPLPGKQARSYPAKPLRILKRSKLQTESKRQTDEPRIVLGLDYGTTHTGLAFMQQTAEREPLFSDLAVFTNWPDGGGGSLKVPSAYSYSPSTRGYRQWGKSIDHNSRVIQFNKLELLPRAPADELTSLLQTLNGLALVKKLRTSADAGIRHDLPRHIAKSPADVVRDFLSKVAREYYLYMRESNDFALGRGNVPLDIVLTHPAEWPHEAMNKTLRAVLSAFHKSLFPTLRDIYFVPEPEACAVFTVQDLEKTHENSLIPGDCIVVCDAGGGTVDLVTYRIEETSPLNMTKVGVITGAHCGAVFIEKAFVEWVESKSRNLDITAKDVGTGGHFILTPRGKTILTRFEVLKCGFTGVESNKLQLPKSLEMDPSFTQYANGVLTITADDMKRFFEHSVNGTIKLIAQQVVHAEAWNQTVSHIFMSGGMSQSPYVFDSVTRWAAGLNIEVKRPKEGWTAVAQGAVLCAMGIGADNAILAKRCPRSYGISGSQIWAQWKHAGTTTDVDSVSGQLMAHDQIKWLVSKGDALLPKQPIRATQRIRCIFEKRNLNCGSTANVVFCATDMDEPPASNLPADKNEVSPLRIDLDRIPRSALSSRSASGMSYMVAEMDVHIVVDYEGSVKATVECGGKTLREYSTNL